MCSSLVVAPLLFLTGYAAAARVADVLVVGGSGRVGASTVRWLDKLSRRNGTPLTIAVGGRDAASFERSRARLVQQGMAGADELSFAPIDLDGSAAALSASRGRLYNLRAPSELCRVIPRSQVAAALAAFELSARVS